MLSRTSLSQTLNNLDLYYEPCREYQVLKDIETTKPYLLIRCKDCSLTDNEWRLINKSVLIDSSSILYFYKFYPDNLESIIHEHQAELSLKSQILVNDTSERWHLYRSGSQENGENLSFDMTRENEILKFTVPDSGRYIISFWFEGAGRDLWPVTWLYVNIEDSTGQRYFSERSDFFRVMIMRDNDRGLVEFPVDIKSADDIFRLTLYNRYVIRGTMKIDNILVRRDGDNIEVHDEKKVLLNNREIYN
jgi:hypothetical protein